MPDFEVTAPDGRRFIVTAPEGASQDEVLRYAQQQFSAAPQRGALERTARVAGQVGAGFNERGAQILGALPDLYNRGLRAMGLPALSEGAYTRGIQGGINAVVGEPPAPEGGLEGAARGAGRGIADTASILMPAAAVGQVAGAGSLVGNAARAMAAQPGTQIAAGAAGGAVAEATGSDAAGLAAALATPFAMRGAARVITPSLTPPDPERARLAAAASREGIRLTPGQQTGNRGLQNVEAAFATLPTTAGPQARLASAQADDFNAAVLRRAGVSGNRATPEVLADAQRTIGAEIGAIANRNTAAFAGAPQQALVDLAQDAAQFGDEAVARVVNARVQQVLGRLDPNGNLPGRAWREIDSAIGEQLAGAQGDLRRYLINLRRTMQDALTAGAGPDEAAALANARRRYGNLIDIENAMAGAGAAAAEGNIGANQLRMAVAQGDRRGYALGRGDLNELSRVGQAFIRPPIANSGTPERTMMANILTGAPVGAGVTAVAMGANPLLSAAGTVAGLAAPRAAQAVYNTEAVRRYLTNRLLQGVVPEVDTPLALALTAGQAPRQVLPPGQPRAP